MDNKMVYESMNAVQAHMAEVGVGLTERNQQQNYNYRGIKNFLDAVSPVLAEYKLLITPSTVHDVTEGVRQTRNGGSMGTATVRLDYVLTNALDGSQHVVQSMGQGMDSGDKAVAKAYTAAYKTMLIQTFAIPMEGMPESEADNNELEHSPMNEDQQTELKGLLMQTETDQQQFCQWLAQVDTLEDMDSSYFDRAKSALTKKLGVKNAGQSESGE